LDSCVPTKNEHYYSVKTSLPETRLVDRFCIAAAAPPVSHHLNQQLPVSLFSHSHVASNIYIIIPNYLYVNPSSLFFEKVFLS